MNNKNGSNPGTILTRLARSKALGWLPPLCVVGGLVSTTACGTTPDPLVGDWEGDTRVGSERNQLTIDNDMAGDATVYFYLSGDLYKADFRVKLRRQIDTKYQLDMQCKGDCSSLDFEMDCTLYDTDMQCDGDGPWSGYQFNWVPR